MDHLEKQFREELTAELGQDQKTVIISGNSYPTDEILGHDELAFKDAFTDWRNEREEGLRSYASEMLRLAPNNQANFRSLVEIFNRSVVIPFLGAGISMPSGYPSWPDFIEKVRENSKIPADQIKALRDKGQYEEAMEVLFKDIGKHQFNHLVDGNFNFEPECAGPIQEFPHFFSGSIVTTNIDRLIWRTYEGCGLKFDEILEGPNAENLNYHLYRKKRVLVHLHGRAYSPKNRILTKTEYDQSYGNEGKLGTVIEKLTHQSLLFIGCSLTIDRTLEAMIEIHHKRGDEVFPQHFAFLPIKENEDMKERQKFLASANIRPIWYEDGDEEFHNKAIEGFLLKMKRGDVE